ncbi:putative O-glycosylation ligase, exosortase A system-associated [Photobacterium sanguinicancri]|uniref:O-glycosylation ligase, exosortase A system-associated n=1 Tax=Photobacterium sanguinicancri TaxID=875932 RepID=A0ABX4G2W7_9GAMM|nr:putative O-glycosylation ligase, exosortase A system-associated [Photobacterium sanguinicancri]OZS45011.1 putative O-glycosylation ligase, exosortase A system-associated [Photobacterium sanguinicancri]OZS45521.1 putative O-glycosylation ligase, exosortase A system-associated [Photobacterium sanguinicancri]
MRDLVFVTAFAFMAVFAIRRPFIALSLWLWSGLFVPTHWLGGFAASFSYNSAFAALTMLGYLILRDKPRFKLTGLFVCVLLFCIHTLLATQFTLAYFELVWFEWVKFFKIILTFIFVCLLVRKKAHFDMVVWAVVLSIGFYGCVEGLKFILSFGGHKIAGPNSHLLSDNNHLAVALCMTIPLALYLFSQEESKIIKYILCGITAFCVISVLGTHSRGGLLGLIIIGGYFWMRSSSKMVSLIVMCLVLSVALFYLPDSWFDRMNTIEQADQDGSFMHRVTSWKIHTLMAMDNPIFGGGFKAAQYAHLWQLTALNIDALSFIPSPEPGEKGLAAHSIYFQVIGDQGFVGFILFAFILSLTYFQLTAVEKYFVNDKSEKNAWEYELAKMLKVSFLAFCAAGAALSLAYLELFWALVAVSNCLYVHSYFCKQHRSQDMTAVKV